MAEITGGAGAAYLAARIDFQRKEPEYGNIDRNMVGMNSNRGLLWTKVSFWVNELEIYGQEILMHSSDVRSWTATVQALITDPQGEMKAYFDDMRKTTNFGYEQVIRMEVNSPELILQLAQHVITPRGKRALREDFPEEAQDEEAIKNALSSYWRSGLTPELLEQDYQSFISTSYSYELLVGIDTAIEAGAGVFGERPAIYLEPSEEEVLRFARELRAEAEMALLLDQDDR